MLLGIDLHSGGAEALAENADGLSAVVIGVEVKNVRAHTIDCWNACCLGGGYIWLSGLPRQCVSVDSNLGTVRVELCLLESHNVAGQ